MRQSGRSLARARAVAWLDRRANYERNPPSAQRSLGLGRMRRLLDQLGSPELQFPAIHVAGTKGKGSTVATLAAILSAAGHRTGRYLSPHVDMLEERLAIDGEPIRTVDLLEAFDRVMPVVDALDAEAARARARGPTWFEVLTAIAFVHFARSKVDLAVLETGLGGRLDATNTCRSILSVITSISLDHMQVLGSTITAIATEKAGIIRRHGTVICGAEHPEAVGVITSIAARRRAALTLLDSDFTVTAEVGERGGLKASVLTQDGRTRNFRLAMAGLHQARNAGLAVMAADELRRMGFNVPSAAVRRGLREARLPARIERVGTRPLTVLDAAHNVASMESLVAALQAHGWNRPPRVLVFAASSDKQIVAMLAAARPHFDAIVLTRYATNPRAATIRELLAASREAGWQTPHVASAPGEAVALGRALATPRGSLCIAGSFFLAAEARAALRDGPPDR
jgi:dihydrofolate synthase/folylpolyglutamate synthase